MVKDSVGAKGTTKVEVRMKFGQRVQGSEGSSVTRTIEVAADGSDCVRAVKERIAVSY